MRAHRVRLRRIAKRIGRTLWNDKVAAAHTVFFLVAAALFLPIIAGLFLFLNDTADSMDKSTAGLRSRAVAGLNQLIQSPGYAEGPGGAGSAYWERNNVSTDPASLWVLREMGLRDTNVSGLSHGKIDNLQRGGLIEDPNDGFVNYPEMKRVLGLGSQYDFHLRLYPVIQTLGVDPYGIDPIRNINVAYVANLTNRQISPNPLGEFLGLHANATAEIAALQALGLNNFEATAYQPQTITPVGSLGYLNALQVKHGDIIGDTSMSYCVSSCVLGGGAKPYWQWFADDYLMLEDGTPRFDVVVFGSATNLARWSNAQGQLMAYLEAGGSIIFLGSKNLPADFISACAGASTTCLLSNTGAGSPVTTPDITNQMLSVPNALRWHNYGTAGPTWDVCGEERRGWIPILIQGTTTDPCMYTHFGATSSDRYGPTGGTLIVSHLEPGNERPAYLANLLSFGAMRVAYLDYGPEIPTDAGVESAERLLTMRMPSGDFLDVKLVFYLWRNDCTASWDVAPGDRCLPG